MGGIRRWGSKNICFSYFPYIGQSKLTSIAKNFGSNYIACTKLLDSLCKSDNIVDQPVLNVIWLSPFNLKI